MSSSAMHVGRSAKVGSAAVGLWIVALVIGAYFVLINVPDYVVLTEESYGPYFWPRAEYLLPHMLGGLVALLIGPLQFWPKIRNNYRKLHRVSGRLYLCSILIGGIAGMVMASTSRITLAYATGLFALAVVWIATASMAYVSIRRRKIEQHQQWMIRSYVVTFGSWVSASCAGSSALRRKTLLRCR